MAEQDTDNRHQRIIFVEPNDVYDKDANNAQQGISLTPKYEDFCISFNLIIEAFSRFKPEGTSEGKDGNGQTKTYSIQWGLTKENMIKRRTSVLQGNRGKDTLSAPDGSFAYSDSDYNYLTTYYTDLTHDSYKEKTQIEGLGVESVQISYESWYTPTVTIKFVDVRGSALFGREEAIHVDEKLTAENIFGAFFTMPYPLFRLQVKGFLGKPVTYQLTCSGFKGEFNSQTGNFEAVATFIGYSWSLLTDIPFAYLVAAPYATYIGADYWERHKNTKEWGLWNDGDTLIPPMKMYDLFQNIKAALGANNFGAATSEQSEELESMANESKTLNELNQRFTQFVKGIRDLVDNKAYIVFDENEKKEQLLLFSKSNTLKISNDVKLKYEEFYESLNAYYVANYENSKNITTEKTPNRWDACPENITFLEKFNISTTDNGDVTSIGVKELTNVTKEGLQELVFNEKDGKLTVNTADFVFDNIVGDTKNNIFENYCYLLDLYDISTLITDRINAINDRKEKILEEINENINLNIIQILSNKDGDVSRNDGFKPFIGNVFKVIFCHLETFCHIMFDSAEEIYNQSKTGARHADFLGIKYDKTDLKKDSTKYVTPWPAIFNTGIDTAECGYKSENSDIYGWVGDLPNHKFIEEKVVYALQEGIQKLVDNKDHDYNSKEFSSFPILPSDYGINHSVFGSTLIGNVSELAGYLALRLTSIIGVLSGNNISDALSKTVGRLDAYNLYSKVASIDTLSNIVKNIDDKILEGIMYCNESEEYEVYAIQDREDSPTPKHHSFETRKIKYNEKGRQPFFIEKGNKSEYVHFYDKEEITYVPSSLKDFKSYANRATDGDFNYSATSIADACFEPNTRQNNEGQTVSYDWLYITDSRKIKVLQDKNDSYINKYMFNIITDSTTINNIKNKYSQIVDGNIKIGEYEVHDNLSDFTDKFLKIGNKTTNKYFQRVAYMLSGNADTLQLDKDNFLPDGNIDSKTPKTLNYTDWYEKINGTFKNNVKINDNGDLLLNGEKKDLSELVIQQFKINYLGSECNIFGCPFYYMQNLLREGETTQDYDYRRIRTKALLFLHTFKYNYMGAKLNIFNKDKRNGATEEVPKGYLLFLGAMLWRKRFFKIKGKDPIIYEYADGTDKYVNCDVDHTLFTIMDNNLYFMVKRNKNEINYNFPVSNLFDGMTNIDDNIENQLISLFEDFAKTTFSNIANRYELINLHNKKTEPYNISNYLINDIKIIHKFFKHEGETETIEFLKAEEFVDKWNLTPNASNFMLWLKNFGFTNWLGKYSIISVLKDINENNQGLKLLFNEKDKEYQDIFKDLYFNTYIVTDSCYRRMGKSNSAVTDGDKIFINNNLLKSYLSGFKDACNDIINSETVSVGGDNEITVSKGTLKNRDLSLAIYYYLKNLWDKWLVIAKTDAFDVKNFFDKNFIFTDSFYKNMYHFLAINCQKLLEAWTQLADNGSVFHFLSRIVTDHGCIFLPVPDYVGFNGETQQHDIEMMEDLFRPLPYLAVEAPSNSNKYVVMYTHSPSHISSEDNAYPTDSYDIWSHELNEPSETARNLFSTTNSIDFDRTRDMATREGYNVPSFGVSFGRQNNHIFKNLKVTMENPVMTEQAIKAQWQIALKGSSSTHSICFIGQDTFNVFSNYSYSINVEMMGNAQICPLMYFQLTNIPLWRGTYMIYKVIHNMTPGDMTTTVTAMKMNKFAQPFNTAFFVVHELPYNNDEARSVENDSCSDGTSQSSSTSSNRGGGNTNTSTDSSGTGGAVQSKSYTKYLPNEKLTSPDGVFKIGKAFKVLYDSRYANVSGGRVIGNIYHTYFGKCTRGPEIILRAAFDDLQMIGNNSSRNNIFNILKTHNFKLKFYGKLHHKPGGRDKGGLNSDKSCMIENIPAVINNVKLQVGDVAYTDGGGKKGHFCMWSGSAWVSDCWQATMAVHAGVTENVWVWSYKYEGQPINMTPNGNSVLQKSGYYPL